MFRNAAHSDTLEDTHVADLMQRFVTAAAEERAEMCMCPKPPHVSKAWHLVMARRQAAELQALLLPEAQDVGPVYVLHVEL